MKSIYNICIVVIAALLAYYYGEEAASFRNTRRKDTPGPIMPNGNWRFTAQRGYFSHDSDPASWEFRARTLPNLGLVEKLYPTDDAKVERSSEELARTQWSRFLHYVDFLNTVDSQKFYKVFYVLRHGQGLHNVKETEVGREEWNVRLQTCALSACHGLND